MVSLKQKQLSILIVGILSQFLCQPSWAAVHLNESDKDMMALFTSGHHLTEGQSWLALACDYESRKNWAKYDACLREAVRLEPILSKAWMRLGILHIDKGEPYFRKVIALAPDWAEPYYWIAYNDLKYGRIKESITMFKQYLQVAKKDDPNESSRRLVATQYTADMEAGETDYNKIIEKHLGQYS